MSENIQYKAIQNLIEELVKAITGSDIDTLLKKAWSKNIIDTQNLTFEPSTNANRKARALVSAVATRVNQDRAVFGKFVSLLREVKGLSYIASRLERELHNPTMNDSQSVSTGASSNSSTASRNPVRPLNEMPKLDTVENITKESGFDESGREQLEPIAGEEVANKEDTSGSTDMVHVPESEANNQYIKVFRRVAGESGGAGVSVTNEDDVNLMVVSHNEDEPTVSPVSVALGSENPSNQQEMVVSSSSQQTLKTEKDPVEGSFDTIRREIDRKNAKISELESELATSRHHELELQKEINTLRKEKEELERKLLAKEEETKRSNEEHEQKIKQMESQLREKEMEVERVRKRLAEAEQQNDIQKQELQSQIDKLEEQRKELESTVGELKDDQKQKDFESAQQILNLREELNKKQCEENCRYRELCKLEVKLANAEAEIAKQKTELVKKDLALEKEKTKNNEMEKETIERENKQLKEEHTRERETSAAKIQDLEAKVQSLEAEKQSCMDSLAQFNSQNEAESNKEPSIEHQSSQTESTGQPSRSVSTEQETSSPVTGQTSNTESTSNSETEQVHFKIGADEEDSTTDPKSKSPVGGEDNTA